MDEDGKRQDNEDERIRSRCTVLCGLSADAWHAAEVEDEGDMP
jgi:hypothetical protein